MTKRDADAGSPSRADLDPAVYKTLLESTKAIPWKIEWPTMRFSYIGPQIEEVLGWTPESWVSAQDWAERIHPKERQHVVDFCISQSKAGVDHEADYRALTKDGRTVWIRDVVHVVRGADGTVEALVGFMFDISERKQNEEKVACLQRELEDMSFKDGLTGVANRRRFDALFEEEWSAAIKGAEPMSIVMIDIDHFKQFNDRDGHLRGDDCLKRVAAALSHGATRPRDLLARYGGEEFVLLLPQTDESGAARVAARCREALAVQAIPHETSTGAFVTASMGAGTTLPKDPAAARAFLEEVDRCLYKAKHAGRNQLVLTRF